MMSYRWILCALALALSAAPLMAAAPAKPNVLFIISDDLNCDLGCYGHSLVQSPNIDRLAQRGVRFEHAYCQFPLCNPSRASLLTGLYPTQTGVLENQTHFRKKQPDVVTLGQLFQQHGYFVARVGKLYHYGVPLQIGTDGLDDKPSWQQVVNPRGVDFTKLDQVHTLQKGQYGGTLSWLNLKSQDEEHTDGHGATAAIKLLEEHHPAKTGKPFFLAVGFYRPHTPYVAPSHYFDLYPREKIEPPMEREGDRDDIPPAAIFDRPHQRELTVDQRKEIIQAYYASISLMDAQVGRVLDALDRLQLEDNTIVVFMSDHGYHLGQHGMWQKRSLFEGSARVPLLIARPGEKNAGKTTKAMAELVDIYPTLADLCDLRAPQHPAGTSLRAALDDVHKPGKAAALTMTYSERRHKGQLFLGHSVRTPRYRYTEWHRGEQGVELYDYQQDPDEYTNLARDEKHADVVREMKSLLEEARQRAQAD
jgi:choline-sulfatase